MEHKDQRTRREFLRDTAILAAGGLLTTVTMCVGAQTVSASEAASGEVLYNGIRLPKQWPPALRG